MSSTVEVVQGMMKEARSREPCSAAASHFSDKLRLAQGHLHDAPTQKVGELGDPNVGRVEQTTGNLH